MMARFGPFSIPLSLFLLACGNDANNGNASVGDDAAPPGDSGLGNPLAELVSTIEQQGNEVLRGEVTPFLIEDCDALPSCFASNATSPYGLWNLPAPPGVALPADSVYPPRTPDGMAPAWQLREDEAVVYIGRTPPAAAYYSYAPYLFSRLNESTGERVPVFASLADALNLVNLVTGPGGPFDAETVLIVTAHAGMAASVGTWLEGAGYDPATFNTVALPATDLLMGYEERADRLMMLQRFALFEDETAGRQYLEEMPVELFRVTPREPLGSDPIAVPARTPRGSGTTEDALAPALDELGAAIRARHGEPSTDPFTMAPAALISSTFDPAVCMRDLTECKGEVSDTTYSAGPLEVTTFGGSLRLTEDPADFFIAFGVNHQAAGKATYSNVVVTNWNKQAGVASLDSRNMSGSAEQYLPGHPDADQLFVVKVARSCGTEPHCIEVPTTFPGVALDQDIVFLFRAYLEPGSTVSPGPTEILTERVLHYVP